MADKTRVLVVDDLQAMRRMIAAALQKRGYEVLHTWNGREAIKIAKAEAPAAIIMDLDMPEMDGVEATRRLQADPETARIPIIILTAHSKEERVFEALRAGAWDFLVKMDLKVDVLVERLQKAIGPAPDGPPSA